MKLLAIDTSTTIASFALTINDQIFNEELTNVKQHAEHLLISIKQLLDEAEIQLSELDGIVFARGPGSFTGLRVACSVTQALAYANDLPVYPVSTLMTIAHQAFSHEKSEYVLSLIDARMQQLYWSYYNTNFNTEKEMVSYAKDIPVISDSTIIAGYNFEDYLDELPDNLQKCKKLTLRPCASQMNVLVQKGYIKPIEAKDALPVYIRDAVTS